MSMLQRALSYHRRQTVPKSVVALFLLLLLFSLAPALSAADEPVGPHCNRGLKAVKLAEDAKLPAVDGDLSKPLWQRASRAATFYDPQTGKPVTDQTEAFLAYDKKYIYVAFYCHDSHPDSIVARETVRDANLGDDDNVRVTFDPFFTRRYDDYDVFVVNPRGTRRTFLGGGRAGKVEWQGDWEAATKRVADGWTAEMRIPWNILSYPRSQGPMTMGVNFRRSQARTKIESLWSDLGPQYFNERDGQWEGVEAPGKTWKPRFSALPYFLPTVAGNSADSQVHIGLDARYQPLPELTGVATVNPDFQSVEGAVEGIGFSRSERYVPDRRPFFLEGANDLTLGETYQLGYLFDTARIKKVDVGAKLYGNLDKKTTLGFLSTIGVGQENNVVAMVRREFSPTYHVNFLAMQRIEQGSDNTVLAIAPNRRWGKWSLDGQAIQSFGPGAGGRAWTGAVNLEDKNLFSTFRFRRVGNDFTDRLGYVPFNDYQGLTSYTNWSGQWRHGKLRGYNVEFQPDWDWHTDGRPFRRDATFDFNFITRSDYNVGAFVSGGKFDSQNDFTYGAFLGGNVSNRFRQWNLQITTGKQADRPYTSVGPGFRLRLFKKLDLAVDSFLQNYDGVSSQHIVTFNYELSPYRSFGGRAVIQDGVVNVYFSYHNSGRAGTDTYFIIGDPNASRFTQRVMMKMVFAL